MRLLWQVLKSAIKGFLDDGMISRAAAISYFTVFALAPVLVIVIAVAGLVFGEDAARGGVVEQLTGLVGDKSAELVQAMLQHAGNRDAGVWATLIGIGALLLTASGIFGEMQSSLNVVWKTAPRMSAFSRLVRARIVSLGLVLALGFLLTVSLLVNAGLAAVDTYLAAFPPGLHVLLQAASFVLSFGMIAGLFAAIYKVLPDTPIAWRHVAVGAIVTALLFTIGKTFVGLYLGGSTIASSFGAAGALALVLLWIYYSALIFLFGAELTRAYAETRRQERATGPPSRAARESERMDLRGS
ncbi:MAG TPA: YihY/virulence factor BrkB family protein, partial [Vineibacter sp.]|nr:YihY/virulence factor BrkB family protein [Vineibacter sp.]